ncbi:MAG TPA: sodium:solute symporter, partial [Hyphomicrobiaceae bacterium]|nr:sodium:solute symporter [Hyphomicrobiaceae bacterium]
GVSDVTSRRLLLGGYLGLFAIIGLAAHTAIPAEFFHVARRVPAFFTGVVLAVVGIGGTGFLALPGALFLAGFDVLCLMLGLVAGFVAMALLIAPFIRKFGAATVPSYLGQRFDSTAVRLVAASVALPALVLLALAELKVAFLAAGWLTGTSDLVTSLIVLLALLSVMVPGGIRSLTWSNAAQGLAMLLALLVPIAIIAVMTTNLPLPQLSHGPVLRALVRTEAASGIPVSIAGALAFELPTDGLQAIAGRFGAPFATIGSAAFAMAMLAVMFGIAGSPALLPRTASTVSVYETRKSLGWAVLLVGIAVPTFSAVAVFLRDFLADNLVGVTPEALPATFKALANLGLTAVDGQPERVTATGLLFRRDGIMITLPVLSGLPAALIDLIAAGVLAAALAGAAASIAQIGVIMGDDVLLALQRERVRNGVRINVTRLAMGLLALVGVWLAAALPGDPLHLFLWSLAVSGSALFPVLLLSIWWKRMNVPGALAGMVVGLLVPIGAFAVVAFGALGDAALLVAVVGVPAAVMAISVATWLGPAPSRHVLELVRDLRIPGGEAISDREARRQAQARPKLG